MKNFIIFSALILSLAAVSFKVSAQGKELYSIEKTISLPGDGGFDYLFVDEANRRLYVSHGTMVHVLDLDTEKSIGTIEGLQGVHGVTIVPKVGKGFITDGKANAVQVFDMKTLKVIKMIPLSGKKPDAIMYEPFSNQVIAFNNGSSNASVIDVNELTEKKMIDLGGAPEFGVSDGKGKFYNNIEDKNHTAIIDAKTLSVVGTISLAPNGTPTSLAYDAKNKRLFSGCREGNVMAVINLTDNKVITTLPICKAVDAIVYDTESKLIYCSGDGTTTIIKQESADKYAVVQTITTKFKAKTMAYDKKLHKIYVSSADYDMTTKKILPNTFGLLVYKMNQDVK
jgi:DNA-binding beta-propeller fold protein YncE